MNGTIKVGVTRAEYVKARDVFEAARGEGIDCVPVPGKEQGLAEAVARLGAQHVIVGVEHYAGPLYEALPRGGVIARFGIGFDGLDLVRATEKGLLCTNTPGALDTSVAEHVMALILAAARNMVGTREWRPQMGTELSGKTLAVIGCGAIGCRVASMAARGFNIRVTGCDTRELDVRKLQTDHGFEKVTRVFDEAVAGADFVSLHLPLSASTLGFLNSERLKKMTPHAWLINTARGGLVNEAALFDAIQGGTIRGAALDVFCKEPYEPVQADKDLRQLPNVIMTAHVASSTVEACRRMAARALQNVALGGRSEYAAMDLLNREVVKP